MSKIKTYIIEGECKWACVLKPVADEYNPVPIYRVTLEVSDEDIKFLKDAGMHPKVGIKEEDGKKFIQFKRKTQRKDGSLIEPLVVVDKDGRRQEENIGNGSRIKAVIKLLPYVSAGQTRVMMSIDAIRVMDLVPYKANSSDGSLRELGLSDDQISNLNTNTMEESYEESNTEVDEDII